MRRGRPSGRARGRPAPSAAPSGDRAVISAWNEPVVGSTNSHGSRQDWSRQRVGSSSSYQRLSASSTGFAGCFVPVNEVVRDGEADALDEAAFAAVDAGVEHVPAAVVLDHAAGPGREVVPAARRARDGARRGAPATAQVARDRVSDRGVVVAQLRIAAASAEPAGRRRGAARASRASQKSQTHLSGRRRGIVAAQPFSDPCSRAATKWRWKTRKTISVGVRISSDPAESSGMSAPHCPWNAPSAPAIVRFVGSSTRTIASRNWFHVQTESRIPSDASAGPGERHVDAPEELPGRGAVDARRLGELARHVQEVRAHPEDAERHVEPDQRQDDRPAACSAGPCRGSRSRSARSRPRTAASDRAGRAGRRAGRRATRRWPSAKPAIVAISDRDRDDRDHDQHARLEDRAHVGDVERVDEVVPVRRATASRGRSGRSRTGAAPS